MPQVILFSLDLSNIVQKKRFLLGFAKFKEFFQFLILFGLSHLLSSLDPLKKFRFHNTASENVWSGLTVNMVV